MSAAASGSTPPAGHRAETAVDGDRDRKDEPADEPAPQRQRGGPGNAMAGRTHLQRHDRHGEAHEQRHDRQHDEAELPQRPRLEVGVDAAEQVDAALVGPLETDQDAHGRDHEQEDQREDDVEPAHGLVITGGHEAVEGGVGCGRVSGIERRRCNLGSCHRNVRTSGLQLASAQGLNPRSGRAFGARIPAADSTKPLWRAGNCVGISWPSSEARPDQLIGGHGGEEKDEVGDRVAEQAHGLARGRGAGQVEGYPQEHGPEDDAPRRRRPGPCRRRGRRPASTPTARSV